ncbi:MAG: cyanoexosortase B system-associated protein [Leptolyngbyaceae cyanobacterium]
MANTIPVLKLKRGWKIALVVLLAILVAISTLPSYFSGSWPWSEPLKAPQINQIKNISKTSLPLPGWDLSVQEEVSISGNKWSLAEYENVGGVLDVEQLPSLVLLLRPQPWHSDQPQVEWVDLKGSQSWQVDNKSNLRFTGSGENGQPHQVTAQYFRAVNEQSTFAVMQWYAWPQGGHPSPSRWFWADQRRQWLKQERQPWIAVSLLLPIEPVGDIRPYQDAASAIAQTVQTALLDGPFAGTT